MHFERVGVLVNINMFDSLLHRNTKLEFEPSLATSWKALSDTAWEFKIRKGVRFHNGEIMTPEDVKYSFDRVLDQTKKSPQYGNIRAIKEVKVVDAETVHIITDKPFPLLLERLVFFCIVPKKHILAVGDQAFGSTAPVGTGPWKFVEWKRDQLIRLEAFDQHWRGKPPFKYLVFRAIPEYATQYAEIKTGGVDIIREVSADITPELKTHPQTYVSSTPILRVHYVELDMRSAPFDKKARAAGGELRGGQADHHAEADGGPRQAGRPPRCSRSPSASIPRSSRTPTTRRRPRSCSPRRAIRTAWTSRCTAPASRTGRSSRPSARC